MRPNDFDITLYDAGGHTLANSVTDPLVALTDQDALDSLVGYLRVYLAQAASLGMVTNAEAIQHFILHAQRAGVLDVAFLEASFDMAIRNEVPPSPPIAPTGLWLTAAGGGMVNASSNLGSYADRYELQQQGGGGWTTVAHGTVRADGVDYQAQGVGAGTHYFRVLARWGFFAGFPGHSVSVEVG